MRYGAMMLVAALGAGCASGPNTNAQMTQAKSAVRAATEMDAEEYANASLHLKMANDQIEKAEAFMAEEEEEAAMRALERAEADAELAVELARVEKVQHEAREALKKVRELQKEGRQAKGLES